VDAVDRLAGTGGAPYHLFYDAVAVRQLQDWLPRSPSRILDLSRRDCRFTDLMLAAGHTVVETVEPSWPAHARSPRWWPVVADRRSLDWLAARSVDAVVAEDRVFSTAVAAEVTLTDVARVLRSGGSMLLCVDSLLSGLSTLADQGRWAELADVPAADVVLVPQDDGSISRCFWPEELETVLDDAGFDVDWVRPRTVLAPATVDHALTDDPARLPSLVETEMGLARDRQGETVGAQLVASARRR
jgi:hypothetical protein